MPMIYARTVHNIDVYNEREIAPGLFAAVDSANMPRVYTETVFRGYVTSWSTRKRGPTWRADAWGPTDDRRFRRGTYKTRAGAIRAMEREAIARHVLPVALEQCDKAPVKLSLF